MVVAMAMDAAKDEVEAEAVVEAETSIWVHTLLINGANYLLKTKSESLKEAKNWQTRN
jgi:hypothetical protein